MEQQPHDSKTDPKIFLTKIIGGKVFTSVVDKADAEDSILKAPGYSLIADGENLGRVKNRITIECPACGCSKEKFEETGRFGCPECYKAFGPFLSPVLRKMHKGLRHVGKIPRRRLSPPVIEERVRLLTLDLEQAVKIENYEGAAELRDEIRSLQSLLNSDS
ncbi:UvrB/UvrC motif-containing protein [Puniceicoccus vermicola]|uniref:UvrB/UvrC motif-containing protein n=1 Tax=Puniceicoccus vermicola TaxID=388746 RepID=A0A7X1B0E4_9BACT|nr:UvrB/UvrC motif-containing protein [Puniceicoccus vermicola]MBC2603316.1 UvrB/UvrC motif-containing protein [Puniceicoccus vermicola]